MRKLTRECTLYEFDGANIHFQLINVMLTEVAELEISMDVSRPACRTQDTHDDFEQRCLTRTVISYLEVKIINLDNFIGWTMMKIRIYFFPF